MALSLLPRQLLLRKKGFVSGKGRRAEQELFTHFEVMKNKLIPLAPASFTRPGIVAAAAVVCGYWLSQILATDFVSAAEMGESSRIVGALSFGLFGILFVLHMIKPLSKAAAILGLCSFGAFTTAMAYQCVPDIPHSLASAKYFFLVTSIIRYVFSVSTVLGLAGVALDTHRCWHMFRTHSDFEI